MAYFLQASPENDPAQVVSVGLQEEALRVLDQAVDALALLIAAWAGSSLGSSFHR